MISGEKIMLTKTLVIVGVSVAIVVAMFLFGKAMDGKPDETKDTGANKDASSK